MAQHAPRDRLGREVEIEITPSVERYPLQHRGLLQSRRADVDHIARIFAHG
jgi:hypothetical protein